MSKAGAPPLLPIFRSQLQAEILTAVILGAGRYSVQELSERFGANQPTVYREVARLLEAGLLRDERAGRTRLLFPNTDSPLYEPLRSLLMVAFGPQEVVGQEFEGLDGLQGLFIHGSWAARYKGEDGPEPGDVDLIAVGDVSDVDAYAAAARVQQRIGREVNVQVLPTRRWQEAGTPFLRGVRTRPLVVIKDVGAPAELEPANGGA